MRADQGAEMAHSSSSYEIAQPISDSTMPVAAQRSRWQMLLSLLVTLLIAVLVYRNRAWILQALALASGARLGWLLAAFAMILVSYLVSSQVFRLVLRSLGHRFGVLRLWATAVTAIVISQAVPAGAVGSYAFLMAAFKRQGVPPAKSAIIAASEAISYVGAMLLIGGFSLGYLATHALLGTSGTTTRHAAIIGAVVVAGSAGLIGFILTRSDATLRRWAMLLTGVWRRLMARGAAEDEGTALVVRLLSTRTMIRTSAPLLGMLVGVQLVALSGHSLALLLVLKSLGVTTSFPVVLTAFGCALITSTVNVLPGGGGTVETVLAAVLLRVGIGAEAVPASMLFRLLNFWALIPVAAGSYGWLTREGKPARAGLEETGG
ncbi:MAG: lysylphosphatidylglycerol synthase transmembrane domain-containing protein [Herpetosiphon sp.]